MKNKKVKQATLFKCFIDPIPTFDVMIEYGGIIHYSWKFHSISLTMREYLFHSPMISIQMGGVDVVLILFRRRRNCNFMYSRETL